MSSLRVGAPAGRPQRPGRAAARRRDRAGSGQPAARRLASPGWVPPSVPPPPPPPALEQLPAPFADRTRLGFFPSFWETLKLIVSRPTEFFGRVRIDQSGSAILFAALSITAGALFETLYALLQQQGMLAALQQFSQQYGLSPEQVSTFEHLIRAQGFLMLPVTVAVHLVALFASAGVFHLCLMLFRGANRGFDATLTVVAYAFGLHLLMVVPFCGSTVALVWEVVVVIIGLGAAHRCGTGKAAGAVLTPLLLGICCLCTCLFAMIMAAASAVGQVLHGANPGSVNM
ncbi:MAG: YIP1 family protein [Anaeromyxobacter sp.]